MNAQERELADLEKLYSQVKIATNDDSQITISVEDLKTIINKTVEEKFAENSEQVGPVGTVISYMGNAAPNGYLKCDGTVYNIKEYPNLSKQIQEQFGTYNYFGGDGETTFAVPDLRGEFLRGTGTNSHEYGGSGADVGVHQIPTLQAISFADQWNITVVGDRAYDDWIGVFSSSDTYKYVGATTNGNLPKRRFASRPTNTSVLYCIKY